MRTIVKIIYALLVSVLFLFTVSGCSLKKDESVASLNNPEMVSFCEIDESRYSIITDKLYEVSLGTGSAFPASDSDIQKIVPECRFFDVPDTEYSFSPLIYNGNPLALIFKNDPALKETVLCGSFYVGVVMKYDEIANAVTFADLVNSNDLIGSAMNYDMMLQCAQSSMGEIDELFDSDYFYNEKPMLLCSDKGLCHLQLTNSIYDLKGNVDYNVDIAYIRIINNDAFSYAYQCVYKSMDKQLQHKCK